MSDDDDELWADEDEPADSNAQYDAVLEDIKDDLTTYGRETIEASSDDEAISKAREWARSRVREDR